MTADDETTTEPAACMPADALASSALPVDMMAEFQDRTAAKLQQDGHLAAIDPTMWVGIISAVIEMFAECRKKRTAGEVAKIMEFPTLIQRARLHRGLRRHVGPAQMRAHETPLTQSLLTVAREASARERLALVQQIDEG